MKIHLSKPGGQAEGPLTLEQVNQGISSGKFRTNEYWAWHEGLSEWIPLYSLPGVVEARAQAAATAEEAKYETQFLAQPDESSDQDSAAGVGFPPEAEPHAAPSAAEPPASKRLQMGSGMPFSALEHIFILTTGEAPAASRSPTTTGLLQQVIGEDWETIRQIVPRDAIAHCAMLKSMGQGSVPPMAWRAMTAFKPDLLQQARDGVHRICVRTFRIETGDLVSAFLFYNKQKLK